MALRRALAAAAAAAAAGSGAAHQLVRPEGLLLLRRPLITGCLEECGAEEQACVTQCQVCVQQHGCHKLRNDCHMCLNDTLHMLHESMMVSDAVRDSGGAPLAREGVRQRLARAQLASLDGKQRLRRARVGVLRAQRQAEWAAAERGVEARQLRGAREELQAEHREVEEWDHSSGQKLRALRADVEELRTGLLKTLQQIVQARRRLEWAKDRLRHSTTPAQRGARARAVRLVGRVVQRLRWKAQAQRRAVSEGLQALEKLRKDAGWLHRGLSKEVAEMERATLKELDDLRLTRAMERASRRQLEGAKRSYRAAAWASQRLREKATKLQVTLQNETLWTTLPPRGAAEGPPLGL